MRDFNLINSNRINVSLESVQKTIEILPHWSVFKISAFGHAGEVTGFAAAPDCHEATRVALCKWIQHHGYNLHSAEKIN